MNALVDSEELRLLRHLSATCSDYLLGLSDEGFCEYAGGIENLLEAMTQADMDYRQWSNDPVD